MNTTRNTVVTQLGQYNQLAVQMGYPIYKDTNTTINSKRGVQAGTWPGDNESDSPRLRYFGIGIRGSSYSLSSVGGDDVPIMVPYKPLATNMDLFHPIPVRMVLKDSLSSAEAANYRIKTPYPSADDHQYDCYWLKLIETNDVDPIRFEQVQSNESRTTYELDAGNITPPIPDGTEVPENVVVTTILQCPIEGWELDEVITQILDGKRELACISEYGLYTGFEHDFGGGNIEALGVQLAMHRCIRGHDLSSPNAKVTENFVLESGNELISQTFN